MANQEARLGIVVYVEDQATGKLARVKAEVQGLGPTSAAASAGMAASVAKVEHSTSRLGTALSHAKGAIGGLITGPLGFLGITAGLFTIGGALTNGIAKVRAFGETVDKTASITGLSIEKASALASALAYVGVDAEKTVKMLGMAEKNLGALTLTTKKAADFQKTYGLSLVDANGHQIDANELLLRSSDYFLNKTIPAGTKAAAMAKIYGKSWQDMVEVLEMGRPKIAATEAEMAKLGLTMTPANMAEWERFRDATRDAGAAMGGLELQLGLMVLPDLTGVVKSFTAYVGTHQAEIHQFFDGAVKGAEALGGFLTGTVIPAVRTLGSAAAAAWGMIPDPLKQLLVGGFAAQKAMKFVFGVDLVKPIAGAITSLFKNATTANMNVQAANVNVAGGGVGNLLGGAGGAAGAAEGAAAGAGGLSVVGIAAGVGAILAAYWLPQILSDHKGGVTQQSVNTNVGQMSGTQQQQLNAMLGNIGSGVQELRSVVGSDWASRSAANIAATNAARGTVPFAGSDWAARSPANLAATIKNAIREGFHYQLGEKASAAALLKGIAARSETKYGHTASKGAIDATFTRDLLHTTKLIVGSNKSAESKLEALKTLQRTATGHSATASHAIRSAIDQEKAVLRAKKLSVSVKTSTSTDVSVTTNVTAAGHTTSTRRVSNSATMSSKPMGGIDGQFTYARGGAYPANRPRIVGERGPELDVPTGPGFVFTAEQTSALRRVLNAGGSGSGGGWSGGSGSAAAFRPQISTDVRLYVTPAPIRRANTVQERYGPSVGSAGSGHHGMEAA